MKKYISIYIFFSFTNLFSQTFVSPINFVENETNKNRLVSSIEKNVKETYTSIGMGQPSTLRMMEKEELRCFKELLKVKNKSLLRNVIKTYCDIGMCNYSTFLMMYNEEEKSTIQKLEW